MPPYEILAGIYDHVMRHVEYSRWLQLIQHIAERYLNGRLHTILEAGAGTGTLGKMLIHTGYSWQGSDVSPGMCRAAQKKTDTQVVCAHAQSLPFQPAFDMVVFLYDGINYLPHLDAYSAFFSEAYRLLLPGGIVLFDITTEYNSLKYFYDIIDHERVGEHEYVRESWYDKKNHIQYNDFSIFISQDTHKDSYRKYRECHKQHIFTTEEIQSIIDPALFSTLGIWDDFSFRRWKKNSERIHFCLKKNTI